MSVPSSSASGMKEFIALKSLEVASSSTSRYGCRPSFLPKYSNKPIVKVSIYANSMLSVK